MRTRAHARFNVVFDISADSDGDIMIELDGHYEGGVIFMTTDQCLELEQRLKAIREAKP